MKEASYVPYSVSPDLSLLQVVQSCRYFSCLFTLRKDPFKSLSFFHLSPYYYWLSQGPCPTSLFLYLYHLSHPQFLSPFSLLLLAFSGPLSYISLPISVPPFPSSVSYILMAKVAYYSKTMINICHGNLNSHSHNLHCSQKFWIIIGHEHMVQKAHN
jgi:hypothetical protein